MALTEHGYVVSACHFSKGMNEVLVEEIVMEAFGEKIPPLVDIEIFMSVQNKLVKPTLAPGQEGPDWVVPFLSAPPYGRHDSDRSLFL